MATAEAQKKWRDKHRFVKRQLNVMTGKRVHQYLGEIAGQFDLRGKGEAVTFAAFVTKALAQHAEFDRHAARMLEDFADIYHRDRDIYAL
ncbi:MAG: hypothetical protein QGI63_06330 [Rhodospirillales bacterium]|mgnify:CR=1 FL=1|jgi:hypothetical protein|nr:hypothetical protein [Rhodospirillales bacterium]MDP6773870.1 hypothetical protein [Rhodospirillales bacterium]